jgi:hypothetical protein
MNDLQLVIQCFVASCSQPVLSEPGEELIELRGDNFSLDPRENCVQLQAWDEKRNLVRRVTGVDSQTRSTLQLRTERFGKKVGTLSLVDRKRPAAQNLELKSARLEFREVFRRFLRREYTGFRLEELSTEANLESSLSPSYPRAFLRSKGVALAAIAAPPGPNVDGVLTFGLIWLDYLRRRESSLSVQGLVIFLPAGSEKNTCLRLRFLDPSLATYAVFLYGEDGSTRAVDLSDYGNVETHLEPCRRRAPAEDHPLHAYLAQLPGIDLLENHDGSFVYRAHGLPFAKIFNGEVRFGLETKRVARSSNLLEIQSLASHLLRFRSPESESRHHPLYLRNPESWLEAQVRGELAEIDPTLLRRPVYGQVPAFAACDRGLLDLLAVDSEGRLAVLELKATEDVHLPLQALDYWIRVEWHLRRREFSGQGYFPGIELNGDAPRLLLVAPALEFHPSNERVLRFFSPQVPVERLGVGLEWRKQLKLMYRV